MSRCSPVRQMQSLYPFLVRQAGGQDFIAHVKGLVKANAHRFQPNDVDPSRRKFWEIREGLDLVLKAKKLDLVEHFGVSQWSEEPNYHDLIGCIGEGGYVHAHQDPVIEKAMHVRINLLVTAPDSGCIPLLDGIPVEVGPGDAWLCFASHCEHATTPVVGKRNRIAVSYGLQVEQRAGFALFSRYLRWKAARQIRGRIWTAIGDTGV
jgi:hypothetical protein